jgi:signal peptidase I
MVSRIKKIISFLFVVKPKNTQNLSKNDKIFAIIKENLYSIVFAIVVVSIIRAFFFQFSYIPSGSMKPGLLVGDYVVVTKYNYGYGPVSLPFEAPLLPKDRIFYNEPKQGDIVIFRLNGDDYVKRLIGLPGDKIQVISSVVYINDKPLKRTFLKDSTDDLSIKSKLYNEEMQSKSYIVQQYNDAYLFYGYSAYSAIENFGPVIVPKDQFFVMGDNRDNSQDSRFKDVSFVKKEQLVGKAGIIFFSIDGSFLQFWKWGEIRWSRIFHIIK